jgi:hypothetical protein
MILHRILNLLVVDEGRRRETRVQDKIAIIVEFQCYERSVLSVNSSQTIGDVVDERCTQKIDKPLA